MEYLSMWMNIEGGGGEVENEGALLDWMSRQMDERVCKRSFLYGINVNAHTDSQPNSLGGHYKPP